MFTIEVRTTKKKQKKKRLTLTACVPWSSFRTGRVPRSWHWRTAAERGQRGYIPRMGITAYTIFGKCRYGVYDKTQDAT